MLVPVASRHGGEGMLGWLGWAGVPSVGAKPWSGRAAARALVGLVCIRQIQGVAVKGQSQKVTNGGLSVSATLLSPLCSASEFECHDKIKAKAGLY